jgi:hypothetical protein
VGIGATFVDNLPAHLIFDRPIVEPKTIRIAFFLAAVCTDAESYLLLAESSRSASA